MPHVRHAGQSTLPASRSAAAAQPGLPAACTLLTVRLHLSGLGDPTLPGLLCTESRQPHIQRQCALICRKRLRQACHSSCVCAGGAAACGGAAAQGLRQAGHRFHKGHGLLLHQPAGQAALPARRGERPVPCLFKLAWTGAVCSRPCAATSEHVLHVVVLPAKVRVESVLQSSNGSLRAYLTRLDHF